MFYNGNQFEVITMKYHSAETAHFIFGQAIKSLVRLATMTTMVLALVVSLIGSTGTVGIALIGTSGLAMTTLATPAYATCMYRGVERPDIPDADCLEAQRTNCVRSLLTPKQYRNCLAVSAAAKAKGAKDCVIGGKVRNDLSDSDCEEAKKTGCVRRLLNDEQYNNCLAAQPGNSCVLNGVVRNDLTEDDCVEAKATGCVKRLLTPAQYENCLDAQPK
jgi:hypothetical protein